jgi:outer membrane biosynthesis protein TonB
MAAFAHLRREERLGLAIAVALHVALVGGLLVESWRSPPKIPPAERMTVSLSDNVSLKSTAPNPSEDAQAAVAPVLAPESAPLPVPTSVPLPAPIEPTVDRTPPPKPVPAARHVPAPKPAPAPKKATTPKQQTSAPKQAAKSPPPKAAQKSGGGSLLGPNFLKGLSSGERSTSGTPAATFGSAQAASLAQAIARQLKPHWAAPEGVDAEKLVTIVRFRLNPDGSLNGNPVVVSQSGVTPSNEAQKGRHAEQAIRAVRLAAPFDLPPEFYDHWKVITSTFDRRL